MASCRNLRYDPATGVVKKEQVAYRAGLPPGGWKAVEMGENDVAFFNPRTLAVIAANATCAPRADTPLRVLLNHLLFGFTDRKVLSEETVQLDGREALKARVSARLDGVPRMFSIYILKKDGCIFDLQYHAPEAGFEEGVPAFEAFVRSFGTLR